MALVLEGKGAPPLHGTKVRQARELCGETGVKIEQFEASGGKNLSFDKQGPFKIIYSNSIGMC